MRWSILCPTLAPRRDRFLRLMDVLLPQAEQYPGEVEVVALFNYGQPLQALRQELLNSARGEFVSFVDDDDLVSEDFVAAVLRALQAQPDADYVAFRHAYYQRGRLYPLPVVTGLQYSGWYNTSDALVRDITCINPVRTELARQAGFERPAGRYEDRGYVQALRPRLADRKQAVIEKVLYHYYHDPSDSASRFSARSGSGPRPQLASPAFRWHPLSEEGIPL